MLLCKTSRCSSLSTGLCKQRNFIIASRIPHVSAFFFLAVTGFERQIICSVIAIALQLSNTYRERSWWHVTRWIYVKMHLQATYQHLPPTQETLFRNWLWWVWMKQNAMKSEWNEQNCVNAQSRNSTINLTILRRIYLFVCQTRVH